MSTPRVEKSAEMHSEACMFAWITVMPDGRECVVGTWTPETGHLPLVSHNRTALEAYREAAIAHGLATSQPVMLVRYAQRQLIERHESRKQ